MAAESNWADQPNAMFPKDLLDQKSTVSTVLTKPLMVADTQEFGSGGTWFKPTTMVDMLQLLKEFGVREKGGCKIVVGNTEVGIGTLVVLVYFSKCL